MIFLSGSMGRVTYLTTPCCKDILKFIKHSINDTVFTTASCCNKARRGDKLKFCTGNLRVASGLAMWTQVRFQKDCGHDAPPAIPKPSLHRDLNFPNFEPYRKESFADIKKTSWGDGDKKPGITYVIGFFGLVAGSYAFKSELTHFLMSMSAAADVLALATIEVDISKVTEGSCVSYKWRGKPLFVKHRSQADIELEEKTPVNSLRDPQTPEDRTQKQEWLVVIGICTHLGCVPIPNSGDYPGGFYCPCHGSHYDNVGRARKGPAPLNLEVPPYTFVSDVLLLVG